MIKPDSKGRRDLSSIGFPDYYFISTNKIYSSRTKRIMDITNMNKIYFIVGDMYKIVLKEELILKVFKYEIDEIDDNDKRNLEFIGYPDYSVIRDGRIWSHISNKFLTKIDYKYCYRVKLYLNKVNRLFSLSKLVALAFVPNDDPMNKTKVKHIDGNNKNDADYNLKWCSTSEIVRGSFSNVNNNPNPIDSCIVHEVCLLIEEGLTNSEILKLIPIPMHTMTCIKNKRAWRYISINYDFETNISSNRILTEDMVRTICSLLEKGYKTKYIYELLGIKRHFVDNIKNKSAWKKISKEYNI